MFVESVFMCVSQDNVLGIGQKEAAVRVLQYGTDGGLVFGVVHYMVRSLGLAPSVCPCRIQANTATNTIIIAFSMYV